MSISSRITQIEQHIGNAYDKIEDLGIDLTDVDKNIDNISSMLENVWQEYPKVSASDVEEASLDGTKKGRMKLDLKGNTKQDGQPSLDNEMPIHNVIGSNEFKIQNKNLAILRNDLTSYGGNINETVIKNDNTGKVISTLIPIKPNTIYTLYREKSTPVSNTRCFYYDTSPVIDETISIGGNYINTGANLVLKITAPSTAKWLFVRWTSDNDTNPCGNVQILEGSYTAETIPEYVPHQEQNLPFSFAEGQRGMEGTTLQDDGIHNKMAQSVVNITSIVTLDGGNIGGIISSTYLPNKVRKSNNYIVCDRAVFNNSRETGTIYENPGNCIIVGTPTDTLQTLQEKYNGSIVEYELAEEEIIPYNETQQAQYNAIKKAQSYDDQTNITQTNEDLPFILNIETLKK